MSIVLEKITKLLNLLKIKIKRKEPKENNILIIYNNII